MYTDEYDTTDIIIERDVEREPRIPRRRAALAFWILACISCGIILWHGTGAPSAFPLGEQIEIPEGSTLRAVSTSFKEQHVVRYALFLRLAVSSTFGDHAVRAGTYRFSEPLSVFEIARAITGGEENVTLLKVTVPEGMRITLIDGIISDTLPEVEPGVFATLAEGKEGYLFPETYLVPETFTARDMVDLMSQTFEEKLAPYRDDIAASGRTENEVITMASIIEREARDEESMRLVSGILWDRLDIGMALQVDAAFEYAFGKTSAELNTDDLEADSPYNTYTRRGLTPTPISNPGIQAIEAALYPEKSPYLYYLTAPDGTFYYAVTFEEHKQNKERYLR